MRRHCNIICPYCSKALTRWVKLKEHIEESHEGLEVPEWILKEVK